MFIAQSRIAGYLEWVVVDLFVNVTMFKLTDI
jgi:hypothetical protein